MSHPARILKRTNLVGTDRRGACCVMKFLLAAATGVLLLLSGCTCSPASPSGDAATAAPSASPTGELLQVLDPLARLTGAHVLMGDAETVNGGTYDSFFEDEVAVLISSGALESTGLQIDKTGDAQNLEEALSYGLNAAVHVRDAGIATLTDTLLTTNGLGAAGVFCTGDGSSAILSGGLLSTAGEASPGHRRARRRRRAAAGHGAAHRQPAIPVPARPGRRAHRGRRHPRQRVGGGPAGAGGRVPHARQLHAQRRGRAPERRSLAHGHGGRPDRQHRRRAVHADGRRIHRLADRRGADPGPEAAPCSPSCPGACRCCATIRRSRASSRSRTAPSWPSRCKTTAPLPAA